MALVELYADVNNRQGREAVQFCTVWRGKAARRSLRPTIPERQLAERKLQHA